MSASARRGYRGAHMQPAWNELQAAFAAAVLDAGAPVPAAVIERSGDHARRAFSVHRNNSKLGLIGALEERFAVTRRLVGEEFFRAMAGEYVREHCPHSPLLLQYGDDFGAFIDAFAPAAELPYLGDVARLEALWSDAYHAADGPSVQPQALANMAPENLLQLRFTLHPSARLLRSVHPVVDIWSAHQRGDAIIAPSGWQSQDLLIVRPDAEVNVHVLGPAIFEFVNALQERLCVAEAAEAALSADSRFDAGRSVVDLFGIGAVAACDFQTWGEMT
jgi:putative DNA-binding protein